MRGHLPLPKKPLVADQRYCLFVDLFTGAIRSQLGRPITLDSISPLTTSPN
jgi:hypothetical protein